MTAVVREPLKKLPLIVFVRSAVHTFSAQTGKQTTKYEKHAESVATYILQSELKHGTRSPESLVMMPGQRDWVVARDVPDLWGTDILAPDAPPDSVEPISSARRMLAAPVSRPAPAKRNISPVAIFGVVMGATSIIALVGGLFYYSVFYYKPTAIKHLPKKCVVAARVELRDFSKFSPISKVLMPALDEALGGASTGAANSSPSLSERMKEMAGTNLSRDVREVAMCVTLDTSPKPPGAKPDPLRGFRAVIAVGGKFKSGIIPGIYETLRSEKIGRHLSLEGSGPQAIIRVAPPLGGVIGQAEDGTILFAPSENVLSVIKEPIDEKTAEANTGLRGKSSFELVAGKLTFSILGALEPVGVIDYDALVSIAKIRQGTVRITLGKKSLVDFDFETESERTAKMAEVSLKKVMDETQTQLSKLKRDYAGEQAMLAATRVARDDLNVKLSMVALEGDLDRGAQELAKTLRDPKSTIRTYWLPLLSYSLGTTVVAPVKPVSSTSTSASASTSASVPRKILRGPRVNPDDDK